MVVCCRIPSPPKKLYSALWELVCLSRPFPPARGEFSVPAQFSLQTSYLCARPVVGSSFAMLVSLTPIAARANGELKRSGWLFLEGRNDFRGDQVRSVWSVWITPSWRRFLCFVRRTTSIQIADLNFFKKFENDTDTFGSWVFLFISMLHAPRVCPTANVTTTSRTSPVATETAKNGWNLPGFRDHGGGVRKCCATTSILRQMGRS